MMILKKVEVEGKEVKLTPTEYNILKFFNEKQGDCVFH